MPSARLAALAVAAVAVGVAVVSIVLLRRGGDEPPVPSAPAASGFALDSPALPAGREIPVGFTCSGADRSPPLAWRGVPGAARSLALVVEDPDAPSGTFTHWLVWGLGTDVDGLPAGVPVGASLESPVHARQGTNSAGDAGWSGPCPPGGTTHRYRFRLLALDAPPAIDPGADAAAFQDAVDGHVLAEADLVRRFTAR